jgi:hypothetical protein
MVGQYLKIYCLVRWKNLFVDISNLSWKETDDFIIRLGIESRFDLGAIDIRSRVFRRVSYALTPNFDAMSK